MREIIKTINAALTIYIARESDAPSKLSDYFFVYTTYFNTDFFNLVDFWRFKGKY